MKKRLVAIMISSITVLALSGCYPTEKKVNENTSSTAFESAPLDNSHFECSKENLTVSFDFPDIPDELPSRIKLKEKIFDHQQAIELFFDGEAPISEYLYGVNEECGQYTARDGSELTIEENLIRYYSGKTLNRESGFELKFPVSYLSVTRVCKEYMRDMYSIAGDELEGFPLQGALDSAMNLISKLGITGYGEPQIYAFSLASYEKMKHNETYMFNEEYPLTKDNEIYIFEFPQLFSGIKVSDLKGVDVKDSTSEWDALIESSSITVGVSKDGVFAFYVDEVYETDGEVLSTEPAKYDLSYAVSEFEKYLNKAYFTQTKAVTINNAEILYYPVERNETNTVEFMPAWVFEGYGSDMEMAAKLGHMSFWDVRYIVNIDVGVVREYSEV